MTNKFVTTWLFTEATNAKLKCKEGKKEQNLFFALFALFAFFASIERLVVPGRRRDGPRAGQLSLDVFLFPSLLTEVAFLALASAMTGAWLTSTWSRSMCGAHCSVSTRASITC